MYWKLVTVVLISFILLVVCYLTLDRGEGVQKYVGMVGITGMTSKNQKDSELDYEPVGLNPGKFKVHFSKEDDFKNGIKKIKTNFKTDEHISYYFPVKCPDYKLGFHIIDTDNGLDKYFVPEEGHLIIVKKDHIWTKEPDFLYWKTD